MVISSNSFVYWYLIFSDPLVNGNVNIELLVFYHLIFFFYVNDHIRFTSVSLKSKIYMYAIVS